MATSSTKMWSTGRTFWRGGMSHHLMLPSPLFAYTVSGFARRQAGSNSSSSERRGYALVIPKGGGLTRSEEHTSELQSLAYLVCRLLLEKKKTKFKKYIFYIHYKHIRRQ